MAGGRNLKRTASKASGSSAPKKKKQVQLEIPSRNKVKCRLLTCGQGDVGQLGLGEDVMETARFKEVTALGDKIVDCCAGGMHTVALDSDGVVWTFGCNDEGALGRVTSGASVEDGLEMKPGKVTLPEPAVEISAGDSHTAALLQNGDVYIWGSFRDSHGSMGLMLSEGEGKSCVSPIKLSLPEQATSIASGGDHICILLRSGTVYTAGCGEQGQLGRLAQRSTSRHARHGLAGLLIPSPVTIKCQISRIWAGSHATLALDPIAGKVLAWGLNNYHQLGITNDKCCTALYRPHEADAFTTALEGNDADSWCMVSCGQHHSIAVDSECVCYAVGRCDYGRLGLGTTEDSKQLSMVPRLSKLKCISIAASTSSSFAVTDNGDLYSWGMGSEGQLGHGGEDDQSEPKLVTSKVLQGKKAVKVSAGGQHTVLLVTNIVDGMEVEPPATVAETPSQKVEDKPDTRPEEKKVEDCEVSSTTTPPANEAAGEDARVNKMMTDDVKSERTQETPMETETNGYKEENEHEDSQVDNKNGTNMKPTDAGIQSKPAPKPEVEGSTTAESREQALT